MELARIMNIYVCVKGGSGLPAGDFVGCMSSAYF